MTALSILTAFQTEVPLSSSEALGLPPEQIFRVAGCSTVVLAVEATLFRSGFMTAVKRGADMLHGERGLVQAIIPVRQTWEQYQPARVNFTYAPPRRDAAWTGYARATASMRNFQDLNLERDYLAGLRNDPSNESLRSALARQLAFYKRFDEADSYFRTLDPTRPADGEEKIALGIIAMRNGTADAAEAFFRAAALLLPNDARPRLKFY